MTFGNDTHWVGFEGGTYFKLSEIAGWEPTEYGGVQYTRVFLISGVTADVQMYHEDFTEVFKEHLKSFGLTP